MTKTVFGARLIQKYSDETTVVPTISTLTDDHTQGWLPTDIYKGELFLNIADNKMWVRTEDTSYIPEVVLADNEGKIPMRFIPNLIAGTGTVTDIFIGGGLSAIDLSSSPISNLQTAGTIMLGVPSSITSTTINETTSNSHTHKFVPAGSDGHIQYKMSDNLVSSSALRFDGESLYISGTTSQSTSHMLYFNTSTGKITYGGVPGGTNVYNGWTIQTQNNGGTQIGSHYVNTDTTVSLRQGTNITLSQTNGLITINGMDTVRSDSTSNPGILRYTGLTRTSGYLYGGATTSPSSTAYYLNYDGRFRATYLYEGSNRVLTQGSYSNNTALTGSNVYSNVTVANGLVTGLTTRSLTASNIGASPTSHATNASTYGYGDATNAGHLRVGNGITVSSGTISIVSNAGSAGSIGTVNISTNTIGVNLGITSTTAAAGNHTHSNYVSTIGDTMTGTLTNTKGFIHPYQDLGYLSSPYVVNWNINDGFNYVVTSPSSFTLNITNLTNGASGNLIIIPATTSINVTISTCTDTGSNNVLKRINGSLTGLTSSIGRYILSWTCSIIGGSRYIHFNMGSYPSLP